MKTYTCTQEYLPVKQWQLLLLTLLLAATPSFTHAGNKHIVAGHAAKQEQVLLPIVWTPLKAYYSQGVVYLSWSSLQESNSSHFDVQRSADGITFYSTGKVQAQSVSDKVVSYNFQDASAEDGMNYYRVQYFDNDGHFQYSNTILMNVKIKGVNITSVYPGPFTDKVHVRIASEEKIPVYISIFDNTGRVVASKQCVVSHGANTVLVDQLGSLAKGIYIIRVQAGDAILSKRLLK